MASNAAVADQYSPSSNETSDESAVDKVFQIAELLEMVLLNLPLKNMFVVQRTCKSFKANMDGSKKLRVAMFLDPGKESAELRVNPLFANIRFKTSYESAWFSRSDIFLKRSTVSPLTMTFSSAIHNGTSQADQIVLSKPRGGESWQRMYVVQPQQAFLKCIFIMEALPKARDWDSVSYGISQLLYGKDRTSRDMFARRAVKAVQIFDALVGLYEKNQMKWDYIMAEEERDERRIWKGAYNDEEEETVL